MEERRRKRQKINKITEKRRMDRSQNKEKKIKMAQNFAAWCIPKFVFNLCVIVRIHNDYYYYYGIIIIKALHKRNFFKEFLFMTVVVVGFVWLW